VYCFFDAYRQLFQDVGEQPPAISSSLVFRIETLSGGLLNGQFYYLFTYVKDGIESMLSPSLAASGTVTNSKLFIKLGSEAVSYDKDTSIRIYRSDAQSYKNYVYSDGPKDPLYRIAELSPGENSYIDNTPQAVAETLPVFDLTRYDLGHLDQTTFRYTKDFITPATPVVNSINDVPDIDKNLFPVVPAEARPVTFAGKTAPHSTGPDSVAFQNRDYDPVLTVIDDPAGNLLPNTYYYYKVCPVYPEDNGGIGAQGYGFFVSKNTRTNASPAKILVSNIYVPTDPRVTSKILYRSLTSTPQDFKEVAILDADVTSYEDDTLEAALGAAYDEFNTAGQYKYKFAFLTLDGGVSSTLDVTVNVTSSHLRWM